MLPIFVKVEIRDLDQKSESQPYGTNYQREDKEIGSC